MGECVSLEAGFETSVCVLTPPLCLLVSRLLFKMKALSIWLTMLAACTIPSSVMSAFPLETTSPNKPFLLSVALVIAFLL